MLEAGVRAGVVRHDSRGPSSLLLSGIGPSLISPTRHWCRCESSHVSAKRPLNTAANNFLGGKQRLNIREDGGSASSPTKALVVSGETAVMERVEQMQGLGSDCT